MGSPELLITADETRARAMTDVMTELPQAESADPDGVQVALRAAHTLWSNGETAESLRWLRRAAETASDEGADLRSLQLAKAAAELRGKLSRGKGAAPDSVSSTGLSPSVPPTSGLTSADAPLSERVVTATQYPSQRPPRSLMGISSATLERVMQRDSSAPPSARAGFDEPKLPPEPPPLPLPEVFSSGSSNGVLEGWGAAKEELGGAALDPRTWSSELSEQEASTRPSSTSSVRPPPMPRGSYGPPPLPDLEDEEVDHDPEFLTDKPFEPGGYEARQRSEPPRPGDEFAPDDWRLPPRELANATFGFAAEPALTPGSGYPPATIPPPSSLERPVTGEPGFSSIVQSALEARPGASDAERAGSGAQAQPLSARVHHQAVRVALASDPRQPGQFILRALREREAPQNGERVALLVALEPGTPLV
jgi:hypothetical protein